MLNSGFDFIILPELADAGRKIKIRPSKPTRLTVRWYLADLDGLTTVKLYQDSDLLLTKKRTYYSEIIKINEWTLCSNVFYNFVIASSYCITSLLQPIFRYTLAMVPQGHIFIAQGVSTTNF
jgi:hypothetical protein